MQTLFMVLFALVTSVAPAQTLTFKVDRTTVLPARITQSEEFDGEFYELSDNAIKLVAGWNIMTSHKLTPNRCLLQVSRKNWDQNKIKTEIDGKEVISYQRDPMVFLKDTEFEFENALKSIYDNSYEYGVWKSGTFGISYKLKGDSVVNPLSLRLFLNCTLAYREKPEIYGQEKLTDYIRTLGPFSVTEK